MNVFVEVPDEAKPVMREIMIMYKDDGIDTYQKVCNLAVEWYLKAYVEFRNEIVMRANLEKGDAGE